MDGVFSWLFRQFEQSNLILRHVAGLNFTIKCQVAPTRQRSHGPSSLPTVTVADRNA